jgi:hypothetical protein
MFDKHVLRILQINFYVVLQSIFELFPRDGFSLYICGWFHHMLLVQIVPRRTAESMYNFFSSLPKDDRTLVLIHGPVLQWHGNRQNVPHDIHV